MRMLESDNICDAFNPAIIQVATSGPMVQAIGKMDASEKKLIAPVAKFVAEQRKNEVNEDAQQLVLVALPSPTSLPGDLS